MHAQSIAAARALLDKPGLKAFSFDIFDTFLLRAAVGPDGVYEQAFHLSPAAQSHPYQREAYVQHRSIAELDARKERQANKQPIEVTIAEIYDHFPTAVYGLSIADRPALAEAEFSAELALCFASPDILALFNEAKARGIRVGFLSDTYWSSQQLRQLLENAAPGLTYDFLYASCEHGYGKSERLFDIYLQQEGLRPDEVAHIGDNEVADIHVPARLGVATAHYPQAPAMLADHFPREVTALQLLQSQRDGFSRRLDGGLRTIRRYLVSQMSETSDVAEHTGMAIIGPVLTAFNRFIAQRVALLQQQAGANVKVVFLARDGHLPFLCWQQAGGEGHYIEINRRIALIGNTADLKPLTKLLNTMHTVTEQGAVDFFHADIPSIRKFFRKRQGQPVTGKEFAEALPNMLRKGDLEQVAAGVRQRLFEYIRATIGGFDDCTDLVLVDLGYHGTIQRTLRGLFDQEGFAHLRMHGVYLAAVDHHFSGLREGDSAAGLIDSATLAPQAMRGILRDIAVVEQFCAAQTGPVKDYRNGKAIREDDDRPAAQKAACEAVQQAALRFMAAYPATAEQFGRDPLADPATARLWCSTLLMRLIYFPTAHELQAFGHFAHHVLGSPVHEKLVDTALVAPFAATLPARQLCQLNQPLMWMAGTMATQSPVMGHLYALHKLGLFGGDMLTDSHGEHLPLTLIRNGDAHPIPAKLTQTAFGETRLRIAIPQQDTGSVVAIALQAPFPRHGIIRSITLQHGDDSMHTLYSLKVEALPQRPRALQCYLDAYRFCAQSDDAYLLLDIPTAKTPVTLITLTIDPLPAEEAEALRKTA